MQQFTLKQWNYKGICYTILALVLASLITLFYIATTMKTTEEANEYIDQMEAELDMKNQQLLYYHVSQQETTQQHGVTPNRDEADYSIQIVPNKGYIIWDCDRFVDFIRFGEKCKLQHIIDADNL